MVIERVFDGYQHIKTKIPKSFKDRSNYLQNVLDIFEKRALVRENGAFMNFPRKITKKQQMVKNCFGADILRNEGFGGFQLASKRFASQNPFTKTRFL